MWFRFDERLGIEIPDFPVPYEAMDATTQAHVVMAWERIRAKIPDRIIALESTINQLQREIEQDDDWDAIVRRFQVISQLASQISDLNHWRRVDPHLSHRSCPAP